MARLVERCSLRLACGTRTYIAFLRPDQMARAGVDDLHGLGLSRAKARTLHALAGQVDAGTLSEERLEAVPSARP